MTWELLPAGLSAVAAGCSAYAAIKLLQISNRTAEATDRAAQAGHASAAATDALRVIEVERGHGELAPRVNLAWVRVGERGEFTVEMRNECWRGYRINAIVVIWNGARMGVGDVEELPSRGVARFWPTRAPGLSHDDAIARIRQLIKEAIVEITWRSDDLWSCPCGRPEDTHWVERRQLPPLPTWRPSLPTRT